MDRLWAPWRIGYIKKIRKKKCIFCAKNETQKNSYIVFKSRHSSCRLNIFPYNNGHLMVSPLRHVKDIAQLSDAELLDLFKSLDLAKKMLDQVLAPQGYNIGMNISVSAGAGITGHLHIHIVPRWRGDTNFMPVLYNTKIISQSLDELYKRLKNVRPKTD